MHNRHLPLGILFAAAFAVCTASAQSGLRQSLERLDTDQDGEIDREEITPLARPWLERVAKSRRMSIDREYGIDKWQEAARVYHAIQNGVSGERVRPDYVPPVRSFGPEDDVPLVPEFGLAEIKFPYTPDDLEEADECLQRCDRNHDGFVDRIEARRGRWTHRDPFAEDYDKDNRLSRMELAQRYARRRLLEGASDELIQRARRVGNGIESSTPKREQRSSRSSYWRNGGSRTYLTASVLSRFDANKNGRLESTEVTSLGIPSGSIDADRNGELTRDELQAYFGELQDQIGDTSEMIPGWFYELDANRNSQIEMLEFTDEWTNEKANEFASYDSNGDGILTSTEVLTSRALVGGNYRNTEAEVLPPRKTVISEIEVTEDYLIGDLNVQLSVTHTYVGYLDGYLTGPDGQRIELFTAVGSNDDHFDNTVFDDQASVPITKTRPPFKGTFQPEALVKKQPSLSSFNGKNVKGVWQLVIRCSRSERFGMLHSWGLVVTPQSDLMDAALPPQANATGPEVAAAVQPPANAAAETQPMERQAEAEQRKTEVRVRQAAGWQQQIEKRLESADLGDEERQILAKKLQDIERYKEHLSQGGSREEFKRSADGGKIKLNNGEKKLLKQARRN
ncbi:proprotein convertase P-domain-containing protein [Planctomycetes bacterium K23_9]|uniref:EF hand n=1 Tax=Stieleria marina TaxID=1930275 RepID=A0A517P0C4_9BACT|nr:EF hand [Planctomycetes bacterium K23_9]